MLRIPTLPSPWSSLGSAFGTATLLTLAGAGCGHSGGGSTEVSLRRGESVRTVLEIRAGAAEGGELDSCDLALVNESDPDTDAALSELDAEVEDPGKSAERKCASRITLDAHEDAVPGEYRVEVVFFYTFSAPFQGTQEGSDVGTVRVTILP